MHHHTWFYTLFFENSNLWMLSVIWIHKVCISLLYSARIV
jgi:hypothetical protein